MPQWLEGILDTVSSTVSQLLLLINENAPVSFWIGALLCVTYWFRRDTLRKFWARVESGQKAFPKLTLWDRVAYPLTFPLLLPERLAGVVIGPEKDRGGPRTLIAAILVLLFAVALGKLAVVAWHAINATPVPTQSPPAKP